MTVDFCRQGICLIDQHDSCFKEDDSDFYHSVTMSPMIIQVKGNQVQVQVMIDAAAWTFPCSSVVSEQSHTNIYME